MLVLTRKVEESIWIGDQIEVKVCQIRGDCVKLAIEAPKSMAINRSEPTTPPPSSGAAENARRISDG